VFTIPKPDQTSNEFKSWYFIFAGSVFAMAIIFSSGYILYNFLNDQTRNLVWRHFGSLVLIPLEFLSITLSFFCLDSFLRKPTVVQLDSLLYLTPIFLLSILLALTFKCKTAGLVYPRL
jgi:hypothetical protein